MENLLLQKAATPIQYASAGDSHPTTYTYILKVHKSSEPITGMANIIKINHVQFDDVPGAAFYRDPT